VRGCLDIVSKLTGESVLAECMELSNLDYNFHLTILHIVCRFDWVYSLSLQSCGESRAVIDEKRSCFGGCMKCALRCNVVRVILDIVNEKFSCCLIVARYVSTLSRPFLGF